MGDFQVVDNFLPEDAFLALQGYCSENEFQEVVAGEKSFSVLPVPDYILPYLERKGYSIILTFIRRAFSGYEEQLRAHCDNYIEGRIPELAAVLYINNEGEVSENGTRFYRHHIHGDKFKGDTAEFDRLILEDAEDESKWEIIDSVYSKPNRLLVYPSCRFHGRFPKKIEFGERRVAVIFYERLQPNNQS